MYGDFIRQQPLEAIDSYTTPLGIGVLITRPAATFIIISGYSRITGTCRSDVAGTLYIYQYIDLTGAPYTTTITVLAGVILGFLVEVIAPYLKWGYLNGAIAQASFNVGIFGKTID